MRLGSDGNRSHAGAAGNGYFRPVCGFDGITLMGYAGKQMNTVKQDFYRVSSEAMEEMGRLLRAEKAGLLCLTFQ
ncbi:MAG: hypothetical protein ACLVAW_01125 [Eisenbergiella massiliensis]